MLRKRLYMTVEEKEQYRALSKRYGINEHQLHRQRVIKSKQQKRSTTTKEDR